MQGADLVTVWRFLSLTVVEVDFHDGCCLGKETVHAIRFDKVRGIPVTCLSLNV